MTTPLTFDQLARLAWAGAAVIAVCLVSLVVCLRGDAVPVTDDVATAARPPLATMPPAGPSAPPCIHEVCGERPKRLRCVAAAAVGGAKCEAFDIEYARHCTCDAWGTVAADGGAL